MVDIPDTPGAPDFSITAQPSNPDPVRLLYQAPALPNGGAAQPGPTQQQPSPTAAALNGPIGPDEVVVVVGQKRYGGWLTVEITRSLESFPSRFSVSLTDAFGDASGQFTMQPGDPCTVMIGQDLILTGRVEAGS